MKENEMDELSKQAVDSTEGAEDTTDLDRRHFFGGLATVLGTAAVIGLAGGKDQAEAKEIKSKILSRIQQQLKQEKGEEGMEYDKSSHSRYTKSGPTPVEPIIAVDQS